MKLQVMTKLLHCTIIVVLYNLNSSVYSVLLVVFYGFKFSFQLHYVKPFKQNCLPVHSMYDKFCLT